MYEDATQSFSQENGRERMLKVNMCVALRTPLRHDVIISPFCSPRLPVGSALCEKATPSFLTVHTLHSFCGSFQGRGST